LPGRVKYREEKIGKRRRIKEEDCKFQIVKIKG
jgi:hypothetical protein